MTYGQWWIVPNIRPIFINGPIAHPFIQSANLIRRLSDRLGMEVQ